MQVNPVTSYLTNSEIEVRANALLDLYVAEIEPIETPPVPVEKIADLLLELNLSWVSIRDTDDEPIMAFIDASKRTIRLNERRQATHFDRHSGLYEYTLGHEVGHYDLHVMRDGTGQMELDVTLASQFETPDEVDTGQGWRPTGQYLCRTRVKSKKTPREHQADVYSSYLLMPERLLQPTIEGVNLLNWQNLYRLRERFSVSISALTNRLNSLGLVYVAPNRTLHRSEDEANGQMRMF